MTSAAEPKRFRSFAEFYPFYLSEHTNAVCRRLHFVGTTLFLACIVMLLVTAEPRYALYAVLCGYGFAWFGHFVFEKNRPATFKHPFYSFVGDLAMYRDIWARRIKL